MSKTRHSSSSHRRRSIPKVWQYITLGMLAALAISVGALALRPTTTSPEVVAKAKAEAAALASERKAIEASAAAAEAAKPIVAIIGDSYTGSTSQGGIDQRNWTKVAKKILSEDGHAVKIAVSGKGGSGYSQAGTAGTKFSSEVENIVTPETDIVVFLGSRNDARATPTELRAAATTAYAAVESIAPKAKIIVVGPIKLPADATARFSDMSNALSHAATDAGAEFVDPTAEKWFSGPLDSLIGEDAVHPTDKGHKLLAEKISPHIESAIN